METNTATAVQRKTKSGQRVIRLDCNVGEAGVLVFATVDVAEQLAVLRQFEPTYGADHCMAPIVAAWILVLDGFEPKDDCYRCNGKGIYHTYGTCFRCGGTGSE